jgi:hypothetical protein
VIGYENKRTCKLELGSESIMRNGYVVVEIDAVESE